MNIETYRLLIWAWMALGLITFIRLLRLDAPFGRHVRPGWGPTLPNAWGWFIMEATVIPSLLVPILRSGRTLSAVEVFMVGLFLLHYVHRALVYPFRLHTRGKRMPVVIVASAVGFNLVNGTMLGTWFGSFAQYPDGWWTDPRFLSGLLLFFFGMILNLRSDYALIDLRRLQDTGYALPRGGWFDRISCPNHFGEMLEWAGFALLTWSLPGVAFAFWTVANVLPRSLAHHRWYQATFTDYPSDRKAVFPGLL